MKSKEKIEKELADLRHSARAGFLNRRGYERMATLFWVMDIDPTAEELMELPASFSIKG